LSIDLGMETRTIVSGIALHFSPEDVVGKQVTVVTNLAPRKMRGIESNGMVLMVDDDRFPLAPGEVPQMKSIRFRTLGCYPLTAAIESDAATLDDIVGEMLTARTSERSGRLIDHDESGSMEKKKREGYF
jgi:sulfate adenylyltransferase subunit 2